MSTPNYLGFLAQMPKESPLQRAIETGLQSYGDVQGLIQKTEETKAKPQLLQSEIQKNLMTGLPPLDQATMAYVHASNTLGEDHPLTQDLKTNYESMLKHQKTLTEYQQVLAGAKDFSTLPEDWRKAILQAGGPAPQLGQGLPLGGGQIPSAQSTGGYNVEGVPMTKPQMDLYNKVAAEQGGQQPGTQQNVQNIYQQQYSPEAKIQQAVKKTQQEETVKENVDRTNELLLGKDGNGGYLGAGISANNTLNSLNQFKKSYDASIAKGAVGGLIFGKLDPQSQIAMKNASQLIMNNMQSLKGVTNRWNISEFNVLAQGNPDITLDPKAVEEIYSEISTALNVLQEQSKLAYSLSKITNNPADLQKIIGYATQKYNPVDSKGDIQIGYLSKMAQLGTPEAVQAIINGKDYDPAIGEYTEEDLKHTAEKRKMSVADVKKLLGIR